MTPWDFEQIGAVLAAVGIAEAAEEPLDVAALAAERGESPGVVGEIVATLRAHGLVLLSEEEPDAPPILTRAGSQYLDRRGRVEPDVLSFLPRYVDDLNARAALIEEGRILVDEFRAAILDGRLVDHARGLAPPAFAEAVDGRIALGLFAAAVALMARLSCGRAAGCTAEEIVAVSLIDDCAAWFERELDRGSIGAADVRPGLDAVRGVYSLFQDDDVLDLFEMEEPADAALAGHSSLNRMMGVVDQRLEAWFRPFGGVQATGHLEKAAPESADPPVG
jgi:hypothetical protein